METQRMVDIDNRQAITAVGGNLDVTSKKRKDLMSFEVGAIRQAEIGNEKALWSQTRAL
jgi:hypothetical protein